MPIILAPLPDPTDVVAQGSYLQPAPVLNVGSDPIAYGFANSESAAGTPFVSSTSEIVAESGLPDQFWPDPPIPLCLPLQSSSQGQPWSNATLCTQSGALIDTFMCTNACVLGAPFMSTTLWQIIGTTRDASGVPLPSCRVIVLAEGYLAVSAQANAVIAETISSAVDGTFVINVPGNGGYGLIAYKPGEPPTVAGITIFNLNATSPG